MRVHRVEICTNLGVVRLHADGTPGYLNWETSGTVNYQASFKIGEVANGKTETLESLARKILAYDKDDQPTSGAIARTIALFAPVIW